MTEINRRKFLIASAGVGAAGLLSGVVAVGWPELMRAAHGHPLGENSRVLVIVTLYGGNDGLSTVIPYTDNAYHDARPHLAYQPTEVLHLDDRLGLNPVLGGLAGMWKDKTLAIVRGVSYPRPDRSHFRSMDIWQTASPDEPVSTGWIGRWLDAAGDDPLRAVSVGPTLPPLGIGEKSTAAAFLASGWGASGPSSSTTAALGVDDPNDSPPMSAVCSSYRATHSTTQTFASLTHNQNPTAGRDDPSSLTAQLATVATCVKAGVPTRVYMTQLGGFDTHADERGTQEQLLGQVDQALTEFLRDMAGHPRGKNVVVMAYSEFGRRVAANASDGTDHGTAGPVFIAGAPVKGGFYGEEPSLTDLDDGDLKATTDFRDVYHELLTKVIDTDPGPSVGHARADIGFL